MIGPPSNTRVWIVAGHTDMRKGFDGLAALVQTALAENPFCGHVFVFRGRRGDILKVLWFDGQGLMLLAKRLERGRFVWPQATSGSVSLTPAQLSMLLEASTGACPLVPTSERISPNLRPEPLYEDASGAPPIASIASTRHSRSLCRPPTTRSTPSRPSP